MLEEDELMIINRIIDELLDMIMGFNESPDIGKQWLDNQDVCKMLDISKRTLQNLRCRGKIPFSIIGKKCFYKASDIEALI